jgi:putative ABC transport system permease protein
MVQLTISNTFRNKWRVLLMQITLVLSGLIFMMVMSVRDSVSYTINDVMFTILGADITYAFEDAQRIEHIEELTLAHPAVKSAEMWGLASGKVRPAGQESSPDDENIQVFGVPLPTNSYGYQLRGGRWLEPEDNYAMVLNAKLAEDVGVGVGDWVTIKYGENKERDWQIVGLVFDPLLPASANVPRAPLLRDLDEVGRAGSVWIKTKTEDPQQQIQIAKELRQYYKDHHIKVAAQRGVFGFGGDATVEVAQAFINNFNFIVILLGIMALIIAAVGGIALSGALSLSVMERRTEIGVMRAIGASSGSIFRLFIGEGLILGWLSWLIALPLSLPAGRLMASIMGQAFQLDMVYHYTPTGAVTWLVIVTILSILASWLPARSATRISVRESLAYQ